MNEVGPEIGLPITAMVKRAVATIAATAEHRSGAEATAVNSTTVEATASAVETAASAVKSATVETATSTMEATTAAVETAAAMAATTATMTAANLDHRSVGRHFR